MLLAIVPNFKLLGVDMAAKVVVQKILLCLVAFFMKIHLVMILGQTNLVLVVERQKILTGVRVVEG